MTFLQPVLLWGLLGVIIPVIIHFWYQKKGKAIAWAATRWLTDKTSLQHRGIRLDEIPLLLLRCLLVILLVLLLSRAAISWLDQTGQTKRVHLVESGERVADAFKFEIEEALKKGEQVFWISKEPVALTNSETVPPLSSGLDYLQQSINAITGKGAQLMLYVGNSPGISLPSRIVVPADFQLMTTVDSTYNRAVNYFAIDASTGLFVDKQSGILKTGDIRENAGATKSGNGPVSVLLEYKNQTEKKTVRAALMAFSEVYKIPFMIDEVASGNKKYDWIFTNDLVTNTDKSTAYVVSGKQYPGVVPAQVISVGDSLKVSSSEMVREGRLPEWFGQQFVHRYNLSQPSDILSGKQLRARFVSMDSAGQQSSDHFGKYLLLGFVMTLLLERWLSLKKNVTQTYA